MEQEQKTAPQERGAVRGTMANLLDWRRQTIVSVAKAMDVDTVTVMEWVCGKTPEAHHAIELARVLRCPVEQIYQVILNTPNLMADQYH